MPTEASLRVLVEIQFPERRLAIRSSSLVRLPILDLVWGRQVHRARFPDFNGHRAKMVNRSLSKLVGLGGRSGALYFSRFWCYAGTYSHWRYNCVIVCLVYLVHDAYVCHKVVFRSYLQGTVM